MSGMEQIVSTEFKPRHYRVLEVLPTHHAHIVPLGWVIERQLTESIIEILRTAQFHSVRDMHNGQVEVRTDVIAMTEREWIDAMAAQFLKGQQHAIRFASNSHLLIG